MGAQQGTSGKRMKVAEWLEEETEEEKKEPEFNAESHCSDKPELFDALARTLVSCQELITCNFSLDIEGKILDGRTIFDRDPFIKSYIKALKEV